MATNIYKMTPAERRARAERVKAQREQRYAYTNYLKAQKEASAKQAQAIRQAEIEAQNERNSQNFLVRGAHTVGNVVGNVVEGAAKGIEGVIDLGAGVVGAAGGLISDDFQNGVKGFVEKDWVGDSFGKLIDESTKYSYTNDGFGGDIVEGVSEGVGQMLPAVILAVATAGASAPASASSIAASTAQTAAHAASLAYTGVSAAGNATEQAYKDGAGYYEGLGYGLASGAVEAATEKLSGGLGKAVFGAGFLDDIGESVAKTGIRRVAKNALGEASEEVIAELANPALKTIYKGSDALKEYKDANYWKGVAEAGLVGGLTSVAYGGTVGYGLARRGMGHVGKDADVNASLEAIDNQRQTATELDAADKLTAENEAKISNNILANYRNIEKTLKSVSEPKRADLISKFSLAEAFDSDGSMNADFTASLTAQSDFDKRYYSYNVRGNEAEILNDLTVITENERSKNPNAETVTMFSGELPDTAKSNFAKLKKGLNYLNKRSERNISLVITNPSKTFNGLLLDGSKMYISADTLDSGDFAGTVVHEYMHVAEGSEQYDKLMSFLKEDSALVESAKKSVIGKAYGISENALNVIQQKIDNGIELSERETEVHNLYQSELGAHMVEYLLGNENFIDRLVRADKGLAGNMLNKITELIGSFKAMGDATSRAEYRRLKQAEWMYLYAVEKAGYKYVNGRIEEDDEEDVEKEIQASYTDKKINYEKQDISTITKESYNHHAWATNELTGFLSPSEIKQFNDVVGEIKGGFKPNRTYDGFYIVEVGEYEKGERTTLIVTDGNFGGPSIERVYKFEFLDDEFSKDLREYIYDNEYKGLSTAVSLYESESGEGFIKTYDRKTTEHFNEFEAKRANSQGTVGSNGTVRNGGNSKSRTRKIVRSYETDDGGIKTEYTDGTVEFTPAEERGKKKGKKIQYSYASTNARRADQSALSQAEQLELSGVDSESIRQETGWFRGYDDAWRYEIDDSKLVYNPNGFFSNPDVERYKALESKFIDASITDTEVEELRTLSKNLAGVNKTPTVLQDYIKHDELFAAYPQLKDIKVSFEDIQDNGSYNSREKKITINRKLRFDEGQVKNTLLHEIQHAIQDIEGLTGGSSVEYWERQREEIVDTLKGARENLELYLKDIGYKDYVTASMQEVMQKKKSLSQHWVDLQNFKDNSKYAQQIKTCEDEIKQYELQYETITNGMSSSEQYFNTAGEVEARDVSDRMDYSAEQRKRTRPDIDRENVVFADSDTSAEVVTLDNGKQYVKATKKSVIKGSDPEKWGQQVTDFINTVLRKGQNIEIETVNGDKLTLTYNTAGKASYRDYIKNPDGTVRPMNDTEYRTKLNAEIHINELAEIAKKRNAPLTPDTKKHRFAKDGFEYRTVYFQDFDGKYYRVTISIGVNGNVNTVYNVGKLKKDTLPGGTIVSTSGSKAGSMSSDGTISNDNSSVNTHSTQNSENDSTKIQSSLKDRPFTPSEKADYYAERAAEKTDNDLYSLLDDMDDTNVAAHEKLYDKRYTKKDAESVLDSIMLDFFVSDEYSVRLKGKGTIVDRIYRVLNDSKAGERAGVVDELADIIVQNAIAENILAYDIDFEAVNNRLSILKFWKNGMDLSEIRSEIKNKYDGDNSVFLRWSSKEGGMRPEEVAAELASDYGIHIKSEHPADIFFEIDDMYMRDLQQIQQKTKFSIDEVIGREDYKTLRAEISRELLRSFDNYGKDTKIKSVQKDFKSFKKEQARNVKEVIDKLNLKARIIYRLYRAVETKYGKFAHASQAENDSLKLVRDALPKILRNGNINKTSTRKILSELSKWYTSKNEMLSGFYDQGIRDSIEYFMTVEDVEGELSLAELRELDKILKHFNYIFANHNRIWRDGRYVDAVKIAETDVENAQKAKEMHSKNGWMRFAKNKTIRFFSDPLSVFRQLDGYNPNGFFTTAFKEFRDGIINAGMAKMDINGDYDAFYAEKGNKKYIKDLMNDKYTVKIGDNEIPKAVAIGLYMTSKTGKALDTLTESGWYLQKKVKGKEGNGVTKIPMPTVTPSMLADMYAQFDERDIRLMEIMDKAYKKCGEYKAKTDNIKYGFTNVMEGTYYPLRRIHADNVDSDDMAAEMDRVSNAGFNKSRVENAKNGFIIENALNVFTRHTAAVSNYYGLSIPVENFNRLWNLDTSGSDVGARMPISVKTVYDSFDGGAGKYVRDLIEDVQGLSSRKDMGSTIVSFIRSNYAKYQLGANPKVWLTQGSSYVAALGKLDVQSLSKGFGIKVSAEDVEKYCDVAALRKYDGGVAKAMSVAETTGNALMKTIGDVDNLIVRRLFGACQVEAKRKYNLEIGTEENKVKAGEILREVILDTQQSAMATEWSAAMRSNSEIVKSFTMFGADSMKACSRFIDAVGEFTALRTQLKDAKGAKKVDADLVSRLEKQMNSAAKNIGRQTTSICSIAVYMTAISELMRFLLNKKDDEDESVAKRVTSETIGNIVGMVPIIRDLWSFFADGYDIDNYAYSAVNDMLTAVKDLFDVIGSATSGAVITKQDTAKMLRKLFYAAGQASGMPTRNFYNYITGIIRRFDEDSAYKIDSLFYKASYKADLAKAIEEGDDEMAETIINMMLAGSGDYSSGTANTMKDLYAKGYDCLPKSVKDTVTVDGVEYTLTNKQYESFKDTYGEANKKVDAVVSSSAFASADDKSKAKMIKFVYDAYYDIARADVVDVDTTSRNALFSEAIDISVLAQVVAQVQSITADTDRKGKTISGSKKKKVQLLVNSLRLTAVQKYMIMGYLGYTNKNGAQAVKSYINRLSLSSVEKDLLYKYSGYAA